MTSLPFVEAARLELERGLEYISKTTQSLFGFTEIPMEKFTPSPVCIKCNFGQTVMSYQSPVPPAEFLILSCLKCGFSWQMKCAPKKD